MRFITVVDPHLTSQNPSTRRDDYSESMLAKVVQIRDMAIEEKVDRVYFLGDVFHNKNVSFIYIAQVAKLLKSFPCPVCTIIGNHDIFWNNIMTLDRTPLGVLISSGVINWVKKDIVGNVVVHGYDYHYDPELSEVIPVPGAVNVLLAHQFIAQNRAPETLSFDDVAKFNLVCLGHDHNFFEPMVLGNTAIIRSGAISRGTQHISNSEREIGVVLCDTDEAKFQFLPLKVKPFTDVFLPEARIKLAIRKSVAEFVHDMEAGFLKKAVSLEDLVGSICGVDKKLSDRVIYYLKEYSVL